MRYWLVKKEAVSISLQDGLLSLTMLARRPPRFAVNDLIVFLEAFEVLEFREIAEVTRVVLFEGKEKNDMQRIRVDLKSLNPLPEGLSLETMQYSLTIVRNTQKPHVHFRHRVRLLPKVDFETLMTAEPFVARSGYFLLFRSMPPELQAAFELEEFVNSSGDSRQIPYRTRFRWLYAFLDERVFQAGRFLELTGGLADQLALVDDAGRAIDHLFVGEAETPGTPNPIADSLAAQRRRFVGLRKALETPLADEVMSGKVDSVSTIVDELERPERREREGRFERLFAALR